jgi:hypothetical protein
VSLKIAGVVTGALVFSGALGWTTPLVASAHTGPQSSGFNCRGVAKRAGGESFQPSATAPGGAIYYDNSELQNISLCSFADGSPYVTADDFNDFSWDNKTVDWSGRLVALEIVFRNEPSELIVVDLSTRRQLFSIDLGGEEGESDGENIGAIAPAMDGDVAWTEQKNNPEDDLTGPYRVVEHDARGTRVLDNTATRPGSLTLRDSKLDWREVNGARRSAVPR